MYYHKLTKKEFDGLYNQICEGLKTGFLAAMSIKVRDHILQCKSCSDLVENYAKNHTKVMMSKDLQSLNDKILFQLEKHTGILVDRHCSYEAERKNCDCLQHQIDKDHCCSCNPENCIKKLKKP